MIIGRSPTSEKGEAFELAHGLIIEIGRSPLSERMQSIIELTHGADD